MLVVDGAIHPRFEPDGESRHVRNGVGVNGSAAVFAISRSPVSLGSFARLFRDGLGCRNALFFDGTVSALHDGEKYLMERGLFGDLAIVHAWKGDTAGNLVYRKTARNFNPMMATAAKITVAEVAHLVPAGEIDPDHIHTPGIFVQRIIEVGTDKKRIEQRTLRKRPA